jgi:hypothetical protein
MDEITTMDDSYHTYMKVAICWLLGAIFPPVFFKDFGRNELHFDTCPFSSSLGRLFLFFMFILKVQMQRTAWCGGWFRLKCKEDIYLLYSVR